MISKLLLIYYYILYKMMMLTVKKTAKRWNFTLTFSYYCKYIYALYAL